MDESQSSLRLNPGVCSEKQAATVPVIELTTCHKFLFQQACDAKTTHFSSWKKLFVNLCLSPRQACKWKENTFWFCLEIKHTQQWKVEEGADFAKEQVYAAVKSVMLNCVFLDARNCISEMTIKWWTVVWVGEVVSAY
jgi:hypothetical protein